ncbi:MAG: glycosyltransferase family 2 protein [Sulfurihydrogenibium sp.]|jgi:cellulose synthase/poly-beta-1,6-N-acetylglucosamine synthase-like glycosyltransferase|nr:glycosyltransferase family 2 protein [Sulfurihydrogenibium sp.]
MGLLIFLLKVYVVLLMLVLLLYIIRHYTFTLNRALGKQRLYYQDVLDENLPMVSVLVPMHNEEKVASYILDFLIASDYPREKLEIIPINDHSTDKTKEILEEYAQKYPFIRPLHRYGDLPRGKQNGLNDVLKIAKGEVIIVYDADYLPPKGQIRTLAIAFKDPRIGAVMGRVVPVNAEKNLLTRLLDIERSGGYQVDQQARYNLNLIPQYGGTVGGFRKDLVMELGGFDTRILAEDTELTYKIYLNGYKVAYANNAECYEESPEDWNVRARQLRRWSRGHNQVMFKYFIPTILSKNLNFWQKIDGLSLLAVYVQPFLIFLGLIDSFLLFFLGEMEITSSYLFLLFIFAYNSFGNFAPFFEIGTALVLDGARQKVFLLPLMFFEFIFNIIYASLGFFDAVMDLITKRTITWQKTERFRNA